jgi:hypothetical protein
VAKTVAYTVAVYYSFFADFANNSCFLAAIIKKGLMDNLSMRA